ncbi:MAG: primosomal protein N' [Planctomycetales bacterium]|nr:primosomal protein N' [Planctomycetales bacterium]
MNLPVAEVAVPAPVPKVFHYWVPEPLDALARVGVRVTVPFGKTNRLLTAYCVGRVARSEWPKLKTIHAVLDREPVLDEKVLRLCRFIADHYRCSLGEALEAALPALVRRTSRPRTLGVIRLLSSEGFVAEAVAGMKSRGATAQAKVLEYLSRLEGREALAGEVRRVGPGAAKAVAALRKRGLIALESRDLPVPEKVPPPADPSPPPTLTTRQSAALSAVAGRIAEGTYRVFLLHGVTGSGKTEVYLRAIEACVGHGRQAILLVPEIALTPQTVARIGGRFRRLAVLHSHVSDAERRSEWERIRAGSVDVVVGARSAIFAPVPRLGLVVVDEEHEPSFKQENAPRYHARDVAIVRARDSSAVVLLGSATPSLESYGNALAGKYELLSLPDRVAGGTLPPVELVDLQREQEETRGVRALSRMLRAALEETLARGEQAILFLNRRGFAPAVRCPRCGHVWRCAQCDVALNYHRAVQRILCHYCGEAQVPPTSCPQCLAPKVRFLGTGTQRLEEELAAAFPEARVARMDSDSMKAIGAYETTLRAVRERAVDVLVGTQMVAKGHDIPNVTLVGVVYADTGLQQPDFRAAERTFQLVAQVAGRAGRGERPGRVIVQTLTPDHYSIVAASGHDYESFAKRELETRKTLAYPPYSRLARVLLQGQKLDRVEERAAAVAAALRPAAEAQGGALLGPALAPLPRLLGRHRLHLLVKAPTATALRAALAPLDAKEWQAKKRGVDLIVDVDPVSLL